MKNLKPMTNPEVMAEIRKAAREAGFEIYNDASTKRGTRYTKIKIGNSVRNSDYQAFTKLVRDRVGYGSYELYTAKGSFLRKSEKRAIRIRTK